MRFLLLLIAAVIAVLAGITAMQLSTPAPTPNAINAQVATAKIATVDVLVARTAIPAGTLITQAMIDKQPWPGPLVLASFIVADAPNSNIVGKVTRAALQEREPFLASKLAAAGDSGFLAANLPAGTRAISISTDAVSGVAGFVFPGDHIDVLFTHNVPQDIRATEAGPSTKGVEKSAASNKPSYSEVLAANVLVLAINVRDNSSKNESGGGVTVAPPSANVSVTPSSMTLQVSDVQAEKIRLAEKVGTLSIALRSLNDHNDPAIADPADLTSLTQVDVEKAAPPTVEDAVKVFRSGDSKGK